MQYSNFTILCLLVATLTAAPVHGRILKPQQQALQDAFPPPLTIERVTVYLTSAQVQEIAGLAGSEPPGKLLVYYRALRDTSAAGYAYFDTHRVRTLDETVMVVVTPSGTATRVEIIAFGEPPDYLPPPLWLEHVAGRTLTDDLAVGRGVRNVTGATLTGRAVTSAVRRALAAHRVLHGQPIMTVSGKDNDQ